MNSVRAYVSSELTKLRGVIEPRLSAQQQDVVRQSQRVSELSAKIEKLSARVAELERDPDEITIDALPEDFVPGGRYADDSERHRHDGGIDYA